MTISTATSVMSFSYGADGMRYKQVKSSAAGVETTHYVDKVAEVVISAGVVSYRSYIDDIAIVTRDEVSGQALDDHRIRYTHRDRLGSVISLTDHNNLLMEHRSYDPFGKPRHGNMQDPLLARLSSIAGGTPFTTRGFTDHEHLDDAELIHMNGRVYDYNLGRFLSVDPFIQAPGNSQSMNPYSYIMNNPLAGTDPSGYRSICKTNVMCDTAWVNPSGKLHLGTIEDKNGVVRKAVIVTTENVKTEDIGSTAIKDVESITIVGNEEINHYKFFPISGGTGNGDFQINEKPLREMLFDAETYRGAIANLSSSLHDSELQDILGDRYDDYVNELSDAFSIGWDKVRLAKSIMAPGFMASGLMAYTQALASYSKAVHTMRNSHRTISLYNFARAPAQHMANPGRYVPVQVLDDAITNTKGYPDPRGSDAIMHYMKIWQNNKQ